MSKNCGIQQAIVVICGMQVNDDVLYCVVANQPSSAYSSLYLSNFLSFHSMNNVLANDFFGIMQARVVIFDMQIVEMCCIVGWRSCLLLLIVRIFVQFSFFQYLESCCFVKDYTAILQDRMFIFVYGFKMVYFNEGLQISLIWRILPVFVIFLLSIR